MNEKKAIFINTTSQVIVRVFGLFFTLISIKLLANYLGPSGTGEYNTINTYVSFFIVVADLGLFSVTVREIVKNPDKEKKILANVFILRLVTALLAAAIASSIIFLTGYNQSIKLGALIASGLIFFNLLSSVYDVILQARLKMQFSALAEFVSKLVALIALITIVRLDLGFLAAVGTITLSGIIILILKWLFARQFVKFMPAYDRNIANWIFALAWPMGIVFILNNLYFKIDTLILFASRGASDVGIYTVAYRVLEVTIFIGAYFASSLKPIISRNIENNKNYVANIVSKSLVIMLLIALPITIISLLYSREIIIFLSNEEFVAGYTALMILAFALPLIYCDMLLGEILVASDQRRLLIRIAAFILSFNVISNLILIPRFSFIGAATVTVVSELVLLSVNLYYTRKIVPYKINYVRLLQVAAASASTVLVTLVIKQTGIHFIVLIMASFAAYATFAYTFGLINPKMLKEVISE